MTPSHSLDISEPDPRKRSEIPPGSPAPASPRPFLSVHFKCANAYLRVLRAADGSGYTARCPRCGIVKNFIVASGGSDQRLFTLTCE